MRRLLLALILINSLFMAWADDVADYIYLTPANGTTGGTVTVYVMLKNPRVSVCAFQCDVILPEGVTIVDNSLAPSDRCPEHRLMSKMVDKGVYRILCYSMNNSSVVRKEGNVASFKVKISPDVEVGTYTYNVKNTVLADSKMISVVSPREVKANLNVQSGSILGDFNRDRQVDANDVSTLVRYVMLNNATGDLNDDGKVDSIDLGTIINIILKENY